MEARMIAGIDHVVLTVSDAEVTSEFYARVLGLEAVTSTGGRRALRCGDQKINLHEVGQEMLPRALRPQPGTADFCLISAVPLEQALERVRSALGEHANDVLMGPFEREGALGPMHSFYLRDPDGNLVEICKYLMKECV